MRNIYYIAVEGVIGVGKTSLCSIIGENFSAKIVYEKFEENPFLEDFYSDRERFAFQTQLYFLLSRYRQHQEMMQVELFHKLLVSDYMFVKDKIFANITLSDKELVLYNSVVTLLERDIPNPDLVIYLQSSTDKLMEKIRERGRHYEELITEDYVQQLNDAYNDFFLRYENSPLLIVNSTDIDFVNNEKDRDNLIEKIRQPFSGTRYYNPKGF
ncbi:MAG: deoxynucleoside kinase [Candidatus Marinimicrobia bacterium]|nr:deoxynucleoside kinase [Candidatus Neomarinimicrobiota bacterium]